MGKYIKKPVEVEAIQFTGDNIEKHMTLSLKNLKSKCITHL